jgi:hypothetical protein
MSEAVELSCGCVVHPNPVKEGDYFITHQIDRACRVCGRLDDEGQQQHVRGVRYSDGLASFRWSAGLM